MTKCIFKDVNDPCNHCMERGLRCTANDKNVGKVGWKGGNSDPFIPGAGILTLDCFPGIQNQETIDSETDVNTALESAIVDLESQEERTPSFLHSPFQILSPTPSNEGSVSEVQELIAQYYEKERQNRKELYDRLVLIHNDPSLRKILSLNRNWRVRDLAWRTLDRCVECGRSKVIVLTSWT